STYTTSGDYTYSHEDANGCTQVDTLHLTIFYSSTDEFSATACDSYTWNDYTYTVSGDYTQHFTDVHGADSTMILHLTINNPTHQAITVTECGNYEWNDSTYTTSGDYTYSHEDANGCTQVDTLHLTIFYSSTDEFSATACDSYTWNDSIYTVSGDYTQHFTDVHGTDSTMTLHLTIHSSPNVAIENHQARCNDSTAIISVQTTCSNILWSTGETTDSILVQVPGTYSVFVTDLNNCTASDTLSLFWHDNPISYLNIPEMCAGNAYSISIGLDSTNNVVLRTIDNSKMVSETIFLPDGQPCGDLGCSYVSTVNFSGYSQNDHIQSAEDIYYLRLNMEHSYASDLFIRLTCPNGNSATVLRFGGNPTSACASSIPNSGRRWITNGYPTVNGTSSATFFGQTHRLGDTHDLCDSTLPNNKPEIGWNYCWSNNSTQGYSYAPYDGRIYRTPNLVNINCDFLGHCDHAFDSSDVANKTQFYHPDESFESLAGCPMNGNWSIEVLDGYQQDNGYMFEWELTLSPELHGRHLFTLDSFYVEGPWTSNIDTNSFTITVPDNIEHDTIVSYSIVLYDSIGCRFDTTFQVHFWPNDSILITDDVCAGMNYQNHGFNINIPFGFASPDTIIAQSFTSTHGCDSVVTLHLNIHNGTYNSIFDSTCNYYTWHNINRTTSGDYVYYYTDEHGCPSRDTLHLTILSPDSTDFTESACGIYAWNDSVYYASGDYVQTFVNASGCDSVVTLHLTVGSTNYTNDTNWVCSRYVWNGIEYTQSGDYTQTLTSTNGCDSVVTLHLTVWPADSTEGTDTVCGSHVWNGIEYTQSGDYTQTLTNAIGCDSVVTLHLTVWPADSTESTDTVCDSYVWNGIEYTQSGDYTQTFTNAIGCDSIVTLHLIVWPTNHTNDTSDVCGGYFWNGIEYTQSGDYTQTLSDIHGCDSIVTLHLSIYDGTFNSFTDSACLTYTWHGMQYTESGEYHYEYINEHGCLSSDTLHLSIFSQSSFSIESSQEDCSDTTALLSVSGNATSYYWSTGATTPTITVPRPGTYSVTATDGNGCTASDTITLAWHENPIFRINIPDMCVGETYNLDISPDTAAAFVLHSNVSSLAVNDTIFLPDGQNCGSGCSYLSPVTFTDFSPNAHIQNVNDIYYLRLNLEHSYSKDIYINLTCPNGQKADILKFGGTANSACASSIAMSSRGWQYGSNASGGVFFGVPNENDNSPKCNASVNPYGTGWNYCWSNNNNQGYSYAGQDGLIYRSSNVVDINCIGSWNCDETFDSSNVAAHTHFYHPDQSFSSLIGCPMNGTWYIEVMDGYGVDNGYIFGWELSLAPELLPNNLFVLDTFTVEGPWITPHNQNSFNITPPTTLTHDTTVAYIVTLFDSAGCSFDTTVWVNIWLPHDTLIDIDICSNTALVFPGFNYLAPNTDTPTDTILTRVIETTNGCDSTIMLHINVWPVYTVSDTVRLFDYQLPNAHNGHLIPTDVPALSSFSTHLNTINGCDSLVNTTVIITGADTVRLDSIVCADNLPLIWGGVTFLHDSTVSINARTSLGRDSVTIMTVRVIPNPIGNIDVDTSLCAGDTLPVSIGYQHTSSILLNSPASTHHESQKIFLPDGMNCQPYGYYYRSYAHFNDFLPGATITSANDILYLRLKMEHSAIEDLRVTLVCPNGTSCKIVPDEDYDGWSPVPHNYFRINLGLANRLTSNLSCDSSLNPIGEPWNYIWSSNTNHGYTYAPGTYSFCYESVNIHPTSNPYWDNSNSELPAHQSYVIDSSDLANMTQIYKPKQDFSTLTGCPLNGDWYVQIQDLQEEDNGYLVEWELAIEPSLLQQAPPAITSRDLIGPWVNRTSDSTFNITPPATLSNDTTASYIVIIHDSAGCDFDTSFDVHFHVGDNLVIYDTIMRNALPYAYSGHTFPVGSGEDTTVTFNLTNINGCDSIIEYHLHILTCDTVIQYLHICESELPYIWDGIVFSHADTVSVNHPNTFGCDSTFIYYLTVTALPDLTVSNDTAIHSGTSATLSASGATFCSWSPATGLNTISGNQVIASPTQSMYYYVSGSNAGENLVFNGDFEQGNVGFQTDYSFRPYSITGYGQYAINSNGHNVWNAGSNVYGVGGTGLFMIVDGADHPDATVWMQTVPVEPNTTYAFSAQVISMLNSYVNNAQALLQFSINGAQVGPIFHAPSTLNTWQQYYEIWNSGNATSATLRILNQNTNGTGNDFGLDDIAFYPLSDCETTDSILVLVYRDIDSTICENDLPLVWNGITFNGPDVVETIINNPDSMDDAVIMHLYVNSNTQSTVNVEIPENDLPYTFLGTTFNTDTANVLFTLENANGCDSIISFSLTVHRNSEQTIDSTICDYELPFFWNGQVLSFDTTISIALHDQFGADSVVTLNLTIIATDIAIQGDITNFCENSTAVLEVITPMENYVWSTYETTQSITVYTPGMYHVTGTQGNCSAQAEYYIESCEYLLLLPNSITPSHGDGLNDFFFIPEAYMPQIADQNFEIAIYNRWGELVFFSKDKHFKWDGKVNGTLYQDVMYNYIMKYSNQFGKKDILKGSILVL
ncbi:MAG: gliding motility-associated C-terminal domain-containing protein, partial [Bacteroidales bacterium]|nr:gliding motility-associated C-terminal domain-containing protein [Bacteroidales bacterium]